jgi:hypothetical protein
MRKDEEENDEEAEADGPDRRRVMRVMLDSSKDRLRRR